MAISHTRGCEGGCARESSQVSTLLESALAPVLIAVDLSELSRWVDDR
jgi:hypothetical protein